MRKYPVLFCFLFLCSNTLAQSAADQPEILAQRGNGVVTQADFTARAQKIPLELRLPALRDGKRVRELVNTLLLRSQLVSDAREAGFDKDPVVVDRMRLAAEAELAEAWSQNYLAMQPAADYEALAYEYYLFNKEKMKTSVKVDVTHILISTATRSNGEAEMLVFSLSEQIRENPQSFDELVKLHSEDPSAVSNLGKFTDVEKGDMVKAFENAAFSLEVGEISEPVRTEFGYHIIRLDGRTEPEKLEYEKVKTRLVKQEREKHETRIMQDYLGSLTSLEVNMTEEALEEMVRRQFGEDYVKPKTDGEDSE